MRICKEIGCGRIHYARNLCSKHYKRLEYYGLPPIDYSIDKSDWTPENIAWLAGLAESEGSCRYTQKNLQWETSYCKSKRNSKSTRSLA